MDYILWDIPLSVLSQGSHYLLWSAGAKCRRTNPMKDKDILDLLEVI